MSFSRNQAPAGRPEQPRHCNLRSPNRAASIDMAARFCSPPRSAQIRINPFGFKPRSISAAGVGGLALPIGLPA
jgi:hypothetical protein